MGKDKEEMLRILVGDKEVKDIENLYGTDIVLNLASSKDGKSWVNIRYSAARNPRGRVEDCSLTFRYFMLNLNQQLAEVSNTDTMKVIVF